MRRVETYEDYTTSTQVMWEAFETPPERQEGQQLVTHAVPDTSYPILKRLGFLDVCTLRRLEDPRAGS